MGRLVILIAALAGAIATLGSAAPTGDSMIDAVLTAMIVAGVTWLGAAALRWDAALITLIAAATSWSIAGAAIGVAAAAIGYTTPLKPDHRPLASALMAGVALNIAARSHLGGFLGLSSIVFVAIAASIAIVGSRRRSSAVRRTTVLLAAGVAGLALLGTVSLGVVGALAAGDADEANDRTRDGLDALRDGDIDAARTAFLEAADAFDRADRLTNSPVTLLASAVPGVAQHRTVAIELTTAAGEATRSLSERLAVVDLDGLTVAGGRIDVDAIRELQAPLLAIELQIERLQATITELDNPWLLPAVDRRLEDLAADVAEQRQRSFDALSVAIAAPGLLGGDEPRTYFVGFTTPAESRGIGGFMGNWAEITVTNGQIEMTRFGRAADLNEAGDPATRRFTTSAGATTDADPQLDEWLVRYGEYHLDSGPDGTTGTEVWKNINMSPDMPTTGRAIADLYPQSGGRTLDGVFIMDVYTLARLLEFTGPIELPDGQLIDGQPRVTVDNAADFLLNDQYDVVRTAERIDILEEFSKSVIDQLLGGTLPAPIDLVDTLGPMVDQGRFTGWAARGPEQDLLDQIGMSGTLPVDPPGDGIAIVFNNAVGNKIDYYLAADATYTVSADAASSTANAELAISLANNAPATGEPNYVIGNGIGLDDGVNRTWISIFSKLPVIDVRLDDRPVAIEIGSEAGYFVTSAFVSIPSGESASLVLTMEGRLDVADGYDLQMRTPPTVGPTPVRVDATWIGSTGERRQVVEPRRDPGLAHIRVDPTS